MKYRGSFGALKLSLGTLVAAAPLGACGDYGGDTMEEVVTTPGAGATSAGSGNEQMSMANGAGGSGQGQSGDSSSPPASAGGAGANAGNAGAMDPPAGMGGGMGESAMGGATSEPEAAMGGAAGTVDEGAMGGAAGAADEGAMGGAAGESGMATPTIEDVECPDPVPSTEACGGDVEGTWAAASCPLMLTGEVNITSIGLGCVSGPITTGSLEVQGTWVVNADGTFTATTITTGTEEFELGPDCLEVSGTVTACDRLSSSLASLGYEKDSVVCEDNADTGGCTCSAAINTLDQTTGEAVAGAALVASSTREMLTDGDYTAADNMLLFTDGRYESEYSYCVTDSTMVLTPSMPNKIGTVTGPIVLQKQE